jgi:hypothetical protein
VKKRGSGVRGTCILRKIGIDDSEFTAPTAEGRVHLFRAGGVTLAGEIPDASTLWGDAAVLARYDMVLLPCGAVQGGIGGSPVASAAQAARRRLAEYADAGGRVFTTDLSYSWLTGESSPYIDTATWIADPSIDEPLSPLSARVDTTFPKGHALAEWLQGIGATPVLGEISLNETYRRSLSPNPPSQRWLYSETPASLQAFTFNTPLDVTSDEQCGRVFYSSFHIAGATFNDITFPASCDTAALTPQERVLEFMLFDLASCVQIDEEPPAPPPVVVK